ncbi:histidine kinase [Parashewanella curva]|uniref:Histidine kinase n=1 Tax=Parashewanella curva TaxID=2338552 RepID=A0A3L8Q2F9_9GAMM|nr:Hpt domain-containing protein [Parashewanella curva]RLV61710.1 histidine kinase [Parashewanella curva]
MAEAKLDPILDLNTLEQYCNAIGASTLLKSVVLFEQLLPEYLDNLIKANESKDKDTLCSEAHKFKGAAGSVGLKRIQQTAQKLQHGEEPDWETDKEVWLNLILDHSANDLKKLKDYLESKA